MFLGMLIAMVMALIIVIWIFLVPRRKGEGTAMPHSDSLWSGRGRTARHCTVNAVGAGHSAISRQGSGSEPFTEPFARQFGMISSHDPGEIGLHHVSDLRVTQRGTFGWLQERGRVHEGHAPGTIIAGRSAENSAICRAKRRPSHIAPGTKRCGSGISCTHAPYLQEISRSAGKSCPLMAEVRITAA